MQTRRGFIGTALTAFAVLPSAVAQAVGNAYDLRMERIGPASSFSR